MPETDDPGELCTSELHADQDAKAETRGLKGLHSKQNRSAWGYG